MTLRVRPLRPEEQDQLAHLARCRQRGAGLVRRAQIVLHAVDGLSAPEIATKMDLCGATVRFWLKRFNERGLAGLEEGVRSGRRPTYSAEEKSTVIRTALTRPAALGLPFACWTLDRLVASLSEQRIGMRRSRISEVLLDEGLKWRQEETWFGERVDPDFAKKREPSNNSIPHHPPVASWCAWTRWVRRPARATQVSGWSIRPGRRQNARVRRSTTAAVVSPALCLVHFSRPAVLRSRRRTRAYARRTSANWIDFLSRVEGWIDPAVERIYAVVDNLNIHSTLDVLLFSLAHPRWEFVFQPKYAADLSLIEPWWKVLRSLALKGRRFEAWAEIEEAVERATAYWNDHKHPFVWGRRRRHRPPRRFGIAALPEALLI